MAVNKTVLSLLLFGIALTSCNKVTDFGADLLSEDQFNISSLRDFRLSAYHLKLDSILTFDFNNSSADSIFLFGNATDPVFGELRSELAFNMRLRNLVAEWNPDNTFDSMTFSIAIDHNNFFGDTLKPLNIYLHQLDERLSPNDSLFYSNRVTSYSPLPIAELNDYRFTPRRLIEKIDTTVQPADTSFVRPLLEFRLDDFGRKLFDNPNMFISGEAFANQFRGMYLRAEGDGPLVGLILTSPRTRAWIYYSRNGEPQRPFEIEISVSNNRYARFFQSTEGFPVQEFLDNLTLGDSLCFIQGMSGVRPVIEIKDLDKVKNKSLKLAQLDFFVADMQANNDEEFPIPSQLVFFGLDKDNKITDAIEVSRLVGSANVVNLGGRVFEDIVNGRRVRRYRLNMTTHILRMLSDLETNKIVLAPLGASKRANRVIIYGPGHSQFPMELRMVVTDIR